ncbi:hypothetical protein BOX15_Mlig001629g3 [Macrostomum lignano]|uniref:Uncharacterized protein n=1 Tax=Macrostomum lignano TaxID=282301 RepID=A0A267FVQ6_9PLAT|nr:hypothetical protein BOX15_Mlig001629g3 [Macrostomum lignano]
MDSKEALKTALLRLFSEATSGKSSLEFDEGRGMLSSTASCKRILTHARGPYLTLADTHVDGANERNAETGTSREFSMMNFFPMLKSPRRMFASPVFTASVFDICSLDCFKRRPIIRERNYTASELQSDMQKADKAWKEQKKATVSAMEQAKRKKAADWRRGSREPKVGRNQRVRLHRVQQPRRSN